MSRMIIFFCMDNLQPCINMGLQSKTEPVWVSCGSNFQIYIYMYNTSVVAHRGFFQAQNNAAMPCWMWSHPFFHQRFACASAWQQRLPGRQGRTEESDGWKPSGSATWDQENADPIFLSCGVLPALWFVNMIMHDNCLWRVVIIPSSLVAIEMTFFPAHWCLFSSAVLALKLRPPTAKLSNLNIS